MQIEEILEKFWKKFLIIWWSLAVPIVLQAKGVSFGKNVRFYGFPIVKRAPGSTISISDRVVLCSDSRFTDLGVYHPVILRTIRSGAKISIGKDCGLSGTAVCCATSISIGNECLIGSSVKIFDTDFHPVSPLNRRYSSDQTKVHAEPITIAENVFIGTQAIVSKGVTIGRNSIIGAGSILTRNVGQDEVFAGNPASLVRKIDT